MSRAVEDSLSPAKGKVAAKQRVCCAKPRGASDVTETLRELESEMIEAANKLVREGGVAAGTRYGNSSAAWARARVARPPAAAGNRTRYRKGRKRGGR